MKKIVCLIVVLILIAGLVTSVAHADFGFNGTLFDTTYKFDYAYVCLPNGKTIEGSVKNWKDWDDGSDFLQVTFTDGVTYYTHSSNIVLVATNGK